jgi:IS30 family transposase
MEKLPEEKNLKALAKVVSRLLFPLRGMGVRTITTDNSCEFCVHEDISKILGNVPVFFADSYASWQKETQQQTQT